MEYTKENLEIITKKSLSIADVCRELNMRPVGGNYKTLKKYFQKYNIDTSHFTGQGWNCGERYRCFGKKLSLHEIMIENSTYTNTNLLKKRLVKENIKEYKCEECGIEQWNGKELSLHLDHINGNNLDNRLENLRILCPNCHSQTETYCNSKITSNISDLRKDKFDNKKENTTIKVVKIKKVKKIKIKNFCECGKEIRKESKRCRICDKINQRKKLPPKEELIVMIKNSSLEAVGRKYNVSGKTIKKWSIQSNCSLVSGNDVPIS